MSKEVREILDKLHRHLTTRMKLMNNENDHCQADDIIEELLNQLDPDIGRLFEERRINWYYS